MQVPVIGAHEITRLIPHRPPFVLLDGIVEYQKGVGLVGIKGVTLSENHFQGHFPGKPIMPGVLVIEALAQACSAFGALEARDWVPGQILTQSEESADTIGVLGSVRVKLKAPVFPGIVLNLAVTKVREAGAGTFFEVRAYSGETTFAEGSIIVSYVPANSLCA
jgi:3-hydroxyacyl-[acyl-carrier-protein] dehydratase